MVRSSLERVSEDIRQEAARLFPASNHSTVALAEVFQEAFIRGASYGTGKREVVNSEAEFESLPLGSIILDARNVIHRKSVRGAVFVGRPAASESVIIFPARVLFT